MKMKNGFVMIKVLFLLALLALPLLGVGGECTCPAINQTCFTVKR